jgi:hypothetical protein
MLLCVAALAHLKTIVVSVVQLATEGPIQKKPALQDTIWVLTVNGAGQTDKLWG